MKRVTNVSTSEPTDRNGRRDPLSGWRMTSDILGYWADESQNVYVESKEQGLVRKDLYMQRNNLYFSVSGNF